MVRSVPTFTGTLFFSLLNKVFQAIDADNSGLITPDELREGFSRLGVAETIEEA